MITEYVGYEFLVDSGEVIRYYLDDKIYTFVYDNNSETANYLVVSCIPKDYSKVVDDINKLRGIIPMGKNEWLLGDSGRTFYIGIYWSDDKQRFDIGITTL